MHLYQHQKDIIKDNPQKTGLFLGTGSAKTLTALLLAEGRILCITPKQQREEQNFIREADKWGLDKNITQLSKEDFKKLAPSLQGYDTVIVDEAHTVAGVTPNIRYKKGVPYPKSSQLYDSLHAYLLRHPPKRLYLLTATPTRSPMCVWGMAQLLGKKWNFYEFRDVFYFHIRKGYTDIFMPKKDEQAKERLGKAVRSLGYTGKLDDYFDVPDQVYKDVYVELTPEQKRHLKEVMVEYPDPLVQVGKRHQVENGIRVGNEFEEGIEIKDNKIDAIKDYAFEFPKMVIFARYTMQVAKIKKVLEDEGYYVLTLQGNTKDRRGTIENAEKAEKCIIIIQSQISAGFELPSFPVMIFASMDYSLCNRVQAEGRILRANALKKNLYITLVAKGGVDASVHKAIKSKVDFQEKIYIKDLALNTK